MRRPPTSSRRPVKGTAMKALILKLLDKTFWKFILVGIVNTLVGTGIMFLLHSILPESDWAYWVSSAANYVVGSIVSYFLNKYYTFQNKSKSIRTVVRFVINITVCYLLAYGIAKPVMAKILSFTTENLQQKGAMLVGMGLFVILNYLGQRFFAFKEEEE